GAERLSDVLVAQWLQVAGLDGVVGPDAGQAIGLQLGAHGLALWPLGVVANLSQDAQLVLDVVTVLVCDDVALGEGPTLRSKARLQLLEEAEVQVDVLVARAVEGAFIGLGHAAAAGLGSLRKQDRLGQTVALAHLLESVTPVLLDAVHEADDATVAAGV